METKLTLRLNKQVIDRAKTYAHLHDISLSKMVEAYLEAVTTQKATATETSPLVESLSGVIDLETDYEFKKGYTNYLTEKYK